MMVQERDLFFKYKFNLQQTLIGFYKQWSAQLFCLISASSNLSAKNAIKWELF